MLNVCICLVYHKQPFGLSILTFLSVVQQFFQTEVNNEYVIRGNSAVLKCAIPSFVADFVGVLSWSDSDGHEYSMNENNFGTVFMDTAYTLIYFYPR